MRTWRFLKIRDHLCLVSCAAASALLLLVPNAGNAQTGLPDLKITAHSDCLGESVTPAAFVSKDACNGCAGDASCDACCRCTCGGPFHRWVCLWDGGLDVGLNGASGNSQDLNLVVGVEAERKWGLKTLSFDLDYFLQQEDAELTKHRLYSMTTCERDIVGSAWSLFGDAWYEYDQFKDFDSRVGLHLGAAVMLKETKNSTLKGRLGAGTSKEFGSLDDEWKPEGLAGLKGEHKMNDRQKLTAKVDYYPDIGDASSFRLNAKANCEVCGNHDESWSRS